MTVATLLELVKVVGVPSAMLILFVWLDISRRKREDQERVALGEKLDDLEKYQRDELQKLVLDNTKALNGLKDASRDIAEVNRSMQDTNRLMIHAIRGRPCLRDAVDQVQEAG